jgi:DNA-binding FadR family transcriptional regulator
MPAGWLSDDEMAKSPSFTPLRRRRLSEELVERILASIATGELRPGAQLPPIAEMPRGFLNAG